MKNQRVYCLKKGKEKVIKILYKNEEYYGERLDQDHLHSLHCKKCKIQKNLNMTNNDNEVYNL